MGLRRVVYLFAWLSIAAFWSSGCFSDTSGTSSAIPVSAASSTGDGGTTGPTTGGDTAGDTSDGTASGDDAQTDGAADGEDTGGEDGQTTPDGGGDLDANDNEGDLNGNDNEGDLGTDGDIGTDGGEEAPPGTPIVVLSVSDTTPTVSDLIFLTCVVTDAGSSLVIEYEFVSSIGGGEIQHDPPANPTASAVIPPGLLFINYQCRGINEAGTGALSDLVRVDVTE